MEIGFSFLATPEELPPDRLAVALEERGFESLWLGEHTQIPVSRQTPYPKGGPMPDQYRRIMDPLISLMSAGGSTTRLKLGTAVALPLQHDVLSLAKAVSTLDRLTDGRVVFGVGVGWNAEELAAHRPVPWRRRYRALAECVGALKTLWTDDPAACQGEFYNFDPVWMLPKPAQRPYPPIYCGMAGKLGTQHAVAWADGWMPVDAGLGDVAKKIGLFRAYAQDQGRMDIPITIATHGNPTLERLHEYRELGVERVIIGGERRAWDDPTFTLPFLDEYAKLIPQLK